MPARKKAAEATATPRARGGVSLCTPELAERICTRLAMGQTLRSICRDDGMPSAHTVIGWTQVNAAFFEQYTRAREVGYLQMADDMIDISDDGRNDSYRDEDGNVVVNHDVIARSRVRIDTRKWLLSKALPKLYGDRLELSGPNGGPIESSQTIQIADLPAEQREQLRTILLSAKRPATITDVDHEEVER